MPNITQDTRLLELQTPLGKDALLIRNIQGREAISHLYSFEIDAFGANDAPVDFAELVGQPVCVSAVLKMDGKRFFHGIVKSLVRGARSDYSTAYRMEIVPTFWLLSQRSQSRIFQQLSVPDILKKVLEGLDTEFEITGTFEPRDYCVQYRETDFAFASRVMEEEGIYYFFRHREDGHTLVLANSAQSHEDLPIENKLYFDDVRGGIEDDEIIYSWEKRQEIKPGKVTLWDHCFELAHKSLDAQEMVDEDLQIGEVTHKLKLAGNDQLELYDFPGGYAQRFDGISPSGAERSGDLQKIYQDNTRTAKIRMQQETVGALQITALTNCLNICPGYKFDLGRHYSDDDTYVITNASVAIPQAGSYGANDVDAAPPPEISFNCIPLKLPFQPHRITPKPTVYGTQTALVTGPAGEEIFTDKYGRVKVQFFWDRHGKFDGDSSCWVRVASPWAGKQWGMIHIPRIGQEVVVAFEEGDPDQPIIVGSVYNSDQTPPHELPANKTQSGVKSRSTPGAGNQNLNEIRFEDKIGAEHIFIHGEKDIHVRCKASYFESIGGDFNQTVGGDSRIEIKGKSSCRVKGDESRVIEATFLQLAESGTNIIDGTAMNLKTDGELRVKGNLVNLIAEAAIKIIATQGIEIADDAGIYLNCKGSSIVITPSSIHITAGMVHINSAAAAGSVANVGIAEGTNPDAPAGAMMPGETKATETPAGSGGAGENTHDEKAEENKDKTHYIEVEMKDESGAPVRGESCEITLPNGKKTTRSTNKDGLIRVDKIDAGNCTVRWINLDQDAISQ
ncbi:MAG: type VI secretion system Vgr family protein [Bryobacteraceae bacterium]